jgi:hypothetical protein
VLFRAEWFCFHAKVLSCFSALHANSSLAIVRGFFISGVSMDPTDLGPATATRPGGTVTVLLAGFLWSRKFLSRDAADRAMDNADIGTVRRVNELLD